MHGSASIPQTREDARANTVTAATARLERLIVPLLSLVMVWLATQVTLANLPSGKIFVGHDSGFYMLKPIEFLRLSAQAWQVKDNFGAPNYQALVTQPLTALQLLVRTFHFDQATMGRIYYELQILLLEFGIFWSVWLTLARAFPAVGGTTRAFAAFFAAMVATFNIFSALLLLYPPSNFQLGIVLWPIVFAAEQYLLWVRPRVSIALLVALLFTIATVGNPAHTILGAALVASLYIVNGRATKQWHPRAAITFAVALVAMTAHVWLPALASIVLYPGGGLSNVAGTDPAQLSAAEWILATRLSVGALLRFDGLIWWPETRLAPLFAAFPLVVTSLVPALIALAAIWSRSAYGRASWIVLLIGIAFAKGMHPPFAIDPSWLYAHVPLVAAFRDTYDKFMLLILMGLPTAYAIGSVYLWQRARQFRALACFGFAAALFNGWPFLAGRVAEPYFLTNVPADYQKVDAVTSGDATNRILSLPGAPGFINVTSWFKGGNFEDFLYRAKTVNAATYKERSISAAPLYDDTSMLQARELPTLMGLLGVYHVSYVLLHKDYLTGYRMAFDYQHYKVLGPLVARVSQPYLGADPRLQKVFEGPNLALYRVRPQATLPYIYGTYDAGLLTGYENTLLGAAASGLFEAQRHPVIFFAGNQPYEPDQGLYGNGLTGPQLDYTLQVPLIPEYPVLYPNQISLPTQFVSAGVKRFIALGKPTAYAFVHPHGDYVNPVLAIPENISGIFFTNRAASFTPSAIVEAHRTPREILADFVGSDGRAAWPVSSYSAQPAPDADLADGHSIRGLDQDRSGLIAATGPALEASLVDDPRISFSYETQTPIAEAAAWLRFVLRAPDGRTYYLDKALDDSGFLGDYGLRDGLQAALDKRFDDLGALHANDRRWLTSLNPFDPEQADDFRLTGVRLIMGKRFSFDTTSTGVSSIRIRGLTISLAGLEPPTYPTRGYDAAFADVTSAPIVSHVRSVTTAHKNGTLLVSASIEKPLPLPAQSLVGQSVDFKIKGAGIFTAHVYSESPDHYVISKHPGIQEQLDKNSIEQITAVREGRSTYGLVMNLPPVDLKKFPELHVRYMEGSETEELHLRIGFDTPRGLVEIAPSAEPDPSGVNQVVPVRWLFPAGSLARLTRISVDGTPLPEPDTSWHEVVCDLRQIEAFNSILNARPRYIKMTFLLDPRSEGTRSTYLFGFGDVAFFGQGKANTLEPPSGTAFSLDSKPLRVVSQTRVGGAPDLLKITYSPVRLAAGTHVLDTNFRRPWSAKAAVLVPAQIQPPTAFPQVRITRIDDLLYGVHVTADRPAWIALTETYNRGWRLIRSAAVPSSRGAWFWSFGWLKPPVPEHLVGNGYNNTWRLDTPGAGDYVIDFAPQNFAIIGRSITILAVALALVVSGLCWRKPW